MAEENLEYQQIMAAGEECARLLNSPVFLLAYKEECDDLFRRFCNTEADHTNTMREVRREANSLARVINRLQSRVKRAEVAFTEAQNEQTGYTGQMPNA